MTKDNARSYSSQRRASVLLHSPAFRETRAHYLGFELLETVLAVMILMTMVGPEAAVCVFVLPHNARRQLSIIAVQVKVEVEHIVKSSEFKFHESRVNETCLFLEGGSP